MGKKAKRNIVIVDDYAPVAQTLSTYVEKMGFLPIVFNNPIAFLENIDAQPFDILITDIKMPDMNGIELLKRVKRLNIKAPVIMVSAHADKQDAIAALKHGAYDFLEKPINREELAATIARTMGFRQAVQERDELARQLSLITAEEGRKWGVGTFVGKSKPMKEVFNKIRLLHKSHRTNVLILGESGTGKELVARAIHFGSKRAEGPFITLNCSAIPDNLAESMLFGHVKGAFTGATSTQQGHFEMANGGTLFLDEIGDMAPMIQTKLLRVLEDGIVCPVGKTKGTKYDVRIISATNTDIKSKHCLRI
jgi:DNA-binding NtrC family response regulator